MTRPLRIIYPGAFYHITSRGNAKANIYADDKDREQFLFILADVIKKYNWRCHAYCLMGNHYHLVIETVDQTLSEGMRSLNGNYTQWYNAKHKRVGHILQGRFKAFLIEEREYLLNVARYVVLNPIRAKMIDDPVGYLWSSYRATAGHERVPDWLTTEKVLVQFSSNKKKAHRQYQKYVLEGLGLISPLHDAAKQGILGSEQFVGEMRHLIDLKFEQQEITLSQRLAGKPPLEAIFEGVTNRKERNAGIILALNILHYTGEEVGKFLGFKATTVCRIAKLARQENHRSQT